MKNVEYYSSEAFLKERIAQMELNNIELRVERETLNINNKKVDMYRLITNYMPSRRSDDYVLSQEEIDSLLSCLAAGEFDWEELK